MHAHVTIGRFADIGEDCVVHSQASIRERVRLGNRVIIQDGVVVGSDGYGFARRSDGTHHKIPQVGGVVIEDDVEIGANSTIDRPAVGETRIAAGTKIDNLVQIAHGVRVGRNVLLAAQVGVAGSSVIEDQVTLAGQVGVAGHITIGKGTIATAQTGIPNSVERGSFISGYPAIPNRDWLKASAVFDGCPNCERPSPNWSGAWRSWRAKPARNPSALPNRSSMIRKFRTVFATTLLALAALLAVDPSVGAAVRPPRNSPTR